MNIRRYPRQRIRDILSEEPIFDEIMLVRTVMVRERCCAWCRAGSQVRTVVRILVVALIILYFVVIR